MSEVLKFSGKTPVDHKVIFGCTECESRSFKIMRYGNSKEIVVRCANCEAVQNGFEITFED